MVGKTTAAMVVGVMDARDKGIQCEADVLCRTTRAALADNVDSLLQHQGTPTASASFFVPSFFAAVLSRTATGEINEHTNSRMSSNNKAHKPQEMVCHCSFQQPHGQGPNVPPAGHEP